MYHLPVSSPVKVFTSKSSKKNQIKKRKKKKEQKRLRMFPLNTQERLSASRMRGSEFLFLMYLDHCGLG